MTETEKRIAEAIKSERDRLVEELRADGFDCEAVDGGVRIAKTGEARIIPIPEQLQP